MQINPTNKTKQNKKRFLVITSCHAKCWLISTTLLWWKVLFFRLAQSKNTAETSSLSVFLFSPPFDH